MKKGRKSQFGIEKGRQRSGARRVKQKGRNLVDENNTQLKHFGKKSETERQEQVRQILSKI